jgi:diacylglycerol kinase family enzyme
MIPSPSVAVIVNRAAHKGGSARRWPAIQAALTSRLGAFEPLFTALVANTENGGGGMKLMPGARFDDGVLDLIELGDIPPLGMLLGVMPKLYSGAHLGHPEVRSCRGTSFKFDSPVETLVDLDGETVGRLPLEVSVLPSAFSVGVPDR